MIDSNSMFWNRNPNGTLILKTNKMKQKTQMQYLIDELIYRAKTEDTISINLIIGLAVVRLEKEKEQIIDAYIQGFCHCEYEGIMDVEKYYMNSFGDSNEAGI